MLLTAYLILATVALSIACLFTLFAPDVSSWIPALTVYGKASPTTNEPLLKAIEVPKKWFQHFYVLAVLNVLFWIIFPFWSHSQMLEYLTPVASRFSSTTAILVLLLMLIHVARRCYETQSICVYSDSKMNIGHYAMGMIHYAILPLTVVCEAEVYRSGVFDWTDISLQQLLGIFLFFFCNYNQHTVVRQMASIRRSSDGKVSKAHGILYGGWFDLVSCPHFLFEIGIYLSFWLLIPQAFTYQFMLLFVAVNQTFAGLLNHRCASSMNPVLLFLPSFLIPLVVGDEPPQPTSNPSYTETQTPVHLSPCKSKNVTLSSKNPEWHLDPVEEFAPDQNCIYNVTFPRGYTANLNVSVRNFFNFNGSYFGLDDAYGSSIGTNGGSSAQHMLDFPAPYLKITLKIGGLWPVQPSLDYLEVKLILHKPFSGVVVVNNPKLDEAPHIYPIGKMNTSETLVFADKGNGNVSMIPLYMDSIDGPSNLVNGHVYELVDGSWRILGTLNNVSHWNHRSYEKIGLYITRPIVSTTYLIGVLEANYHHYKTWNATMNLAYDDVNIGPVFCMDATDGPVAQTVWTSPHFFESSTGFYGTASYLIIERLEFETNDTVIWVYDNFPTANASLKHLHWTIVDETSYLPALLVGPVKTFVLEKGRACISTQNVPDHQREYPDKTDSILWSIPSINRKGFLSFQPEKNTITEYKFNSKLEGEDGDQPVNFFWQFTIIPGSMTGIMNNTLCTMNATYNKKSENYIISGPATDGASWDQSVYFWADSVVFNVHLRDQPIYLEFGMYQDDIRSSSRGLVLLQMFIALCGYMYWSWRVENV